MHELRHPELEGQYFLYAILTDSCAVLNGKLNQTIAFGISGANAFPSSAGRYTMKRAVAGELLGIRIYPNKEYALEDERKVKKWFCSDSCIDSPELTFDTPERRDWIQKHFDDPDTILKGLTLKEYVSSYANFRYGRRYGKRMVRKGKKRVKVSEEEAQAARQKREEAQRRRDAILASFTVDTPIDEYVEKLGISIRHAQRLKKDLFDGQPSVVKQERDDGIMELHRAGFTVRAIAEETGWSRGYVWNVINRA